MDQDTPTGSDKRPWRERLGIGTKEMPKISAEFKKAAPTAERQGPRSPQPVTRPAPMAPRAPARPSPAPVPTAANRPAAAQDALAERLKAQRAAAEKLAEQRVNAARLRAEAAKPQDLKPAARTEPALGPVPPSARGEAARPKFTFADDDAARSGREAASSGRQPGAGVPPPPLMPPRPSLGGVRTMPSVSPAYPGQGGFAPSRAAPPSPPAQRSSGYRPIDPATGYPPPRSAPGYAGPPVTAEYGHRTEYAEPRSAPQRQPGYATQYRRPSDEQNFPEERGDPRLARSMSRQRGAYYDEELDDVFEEDEPKTRRRASASDYNRAYREVEDGFEDEDRQRSSGPWLLLLALLLAAVATGGIVWYYQTNIKTAGDGATTGGSVPVVGAPEQPAKTQPEQPATDAGAQGRKQIYDRIVGEQEVQGGEMVPTEEVPVQLDQQGGADSFNQIPEPAGAADQDQLGDDPIPLPPPPGSNGDTQGFNATGGGGTAIAKTSASQATVAAVDADPGGNDGAASVTQAAPPSDDEPALTESPAQQTATVQTEPSTSAGDASGPVVLVPTLQDTAPPLANDEAGAPLALDPQTADPIIAQPPLAQPAPQPQPARKKTLLSLFTGDEAPPAPETDPSNSALTTQSNGAVTTQPAVQHQSIERSQDLSRAQTRPKAQSQPAPQVESQPLPETQVASIPEPVPETQPAPAPTPAPAPQAQAPAANGYFVQLASFRSEAEAQAEFGRLKSKHGGLIGSYQSIISTATVAGSTRYRLALGPFGSRDQASGLCNSLVAAGERDCLVRRQ